MRTSIDPVVLDEKGPISPSTTATTETLVAGETHWLVRWWSERRDGSIERDETDGGYEDHYTVETRILHERPKGYPQVATFQSSDPNFLQYRGFSYLHCRLLSDLQYEIEALETELHELDEYDLEHDKRKLTCRNRDMTRSSGDMQAEDWPDHLKRTRSQVFVELKAKLGEYDEYLLKAREIMSLQRPSKRDYESVRIWFRDNEPLVRREGSFIRQKEDIVTLRSGRDSAGFDAWLEVCLHRTDRVLRKAGINVIRYMFLTPELRAKTKSQYVYFYAPERVERLVNLVITAVVFFLLILPVIIMYKVTNLGKGQSPSPLDAIGVLIVFTLVFGMAISALTTAKRHELFGASAAYAGVLVIFIGNFQQAEILS